MVQVPVQDLRMLSVSEIIRRVALMTLRLASYDRCASRMSVISISGLTLGYLTLPAASAAGLPGSCLTRNADVSGRILPSVTTFAPSALSSSEEKVGTLRR